MLVLVLDLQTLARQPLQMRHHQHQEASQHPGSHAKSQAQSQNQRIPALQNPRRRLGSLASLLSLRIQMQPLCGKGEQKLLWKRRLHQYRSMRSQFYRTLPHRNQGPLSQYLCHHSQSNRPWLHSLPVC